MMEVNQPLGTNALELPKISAVVDSSTTDSLEDISAIQQNGLSKGSVPLVDEDEEMEQLLYTDGEDLEDHALQPIVTGDETELVQNISDTLVDDIIQLNKGSLPSDDVVVEPMDQDEEESLPPSDVQNLKETAVVGEVEEIINSATVPKDIDLEDEENILLEEDDAEVDDIHEADENLLLEDVELEDDSSTRGSGIQIEDCTTNEENVEVSTFTDSSITVVDESGLSILNTAAVDIEDIAGDISAKDEAVVAGKEGSAPVFTLMEEMVSTMADNLKTSDPEGIGSKPEGIEIDESALSSPEMSDLIKFPDVDKIVTQADEADACNEADAANIEISDLIKLSDSTLLERKVASNKIATTKPVESENSPAGTDKVHQESGDSCTLDTQSQSGEQVDKEVQETSTENEEQIKCVQEELNMDETEAIEADSANDVEVETVGATKTTSKKDEVMLQDDDKSQDGALEQTESKLKSTTNKPAADAADEVAGEVSDLIRFSTVLDAPVPGKSDNTDVELSDLIKFPDASLVDEKPSDEAAKEKEEVLVEIPEAPREKAQAANLKEAECEEALKNASDEDKSEKSKKAPSETSGKVNETSSTGEVGDEVQHAKADNKSSKEVTDEEVKDTQNTGVEKPSNEISELHAPKDSVSSEGATVVESSLQADKSDGAVTQNSKEEIATDKSEHSDKNNEDVSKEQTTDDKSGDASSDTDSTTAQRKEDPSRPLEVCAQALQAADEEDLLEMMDEPERMEEDEGEDDPDDNSSESGSAKQTGDENEEEVEEDTAQIEEQYQENDGTTEDLPETPGEEAAEGEPPRKRRRSSDVEKVVDDKKKPRESDPKEKPADETKADKAEEKKVADENKKDEVDDEKKDELLKTEKDSEAKKPDGDSTKKLEKEAADKTEKVDNSEDAVEEKKLAGSESDAEAQSVESVVKTDEPKKEDVEKADATKEPKVTENEAVKTDGESVKLEEKRAEGDEKLEKSSAEKSVDVSKKEDEQDEQLNEVTGRMEKKGAQDEVLVIDDDDDVQTKAEVVKKEEEVTATPTSKRPCPTDDADDKTESEAAKKIRLSDEKSGQKPEEKKDDKKVADKEEKKSPLDSIGPLKIDLDPEPDVIEERKPVRLDFLEKFKKPLEKMNRADLEQFVLQKIVEGIGFKSTLAEMRTQLDSQDQLLQGYRQKVHDLNKQFKDLEMVHERVVKDLEKKNQHFITPVKITRAVGLQVSQPRFAVGTRPVTGGVAISPKPINRSPVTTPITSPNKSSPQNTLPIRRQSYTRVTPIVATAKTPVQQNVISRPGVQQGIMNKISPASSPSTPVNKAITPLAQNSAATNATATANTSTQQQPAPMVTLPTNVSTPLMRRKPLQKFTPMRPPLSMTQQVQQQQQTRQMQEQLVRQQIQDVQTNSPQPQSPLTQSPQGSPLTRTPEPSPSPSPVGVPSSRVAPIVMKKIGQQPVKTTTPPIVQTATRPAANTVVRSNSNPTTTSAPTVDNSLIDLTDEDDPPKPLAVAAAAPNNTSVVPKPPITLLNNGQQQSQYAQRQTTSLPPLVVINNQQRMVARPALQQRSVVGAVVNGTGTNRPVLIQRAANPSGFPRAITTQTVFRPRMANGQIDASRRLVARPPMRPQPATHPAPLPQPGAQVTNPNWKQAPPRPSIRINNIETGIVISWTMDDLSDNHATIVSYQIYAYQETTAAPSMDMWRHVGDVKAMLLPMAVTLTQFQEGQRYHFAVRAVDEHQRVGQFSPPRTWNESTPGKA